MVYFYKQNINKTQEEDYAEYRVTWKIFPVALIYIAALSGCQDSKEVDKKLVKFRKELVAKKKSEIIPQGYCEPSFLVECE